MLDLDGVIVPSPLILLFNQKGSVSGLNQNPQGPFSLSESDLNHLEQILSDLKKLIDDLLRNNRWANLKTVQEISQILQGRGGPMSAIDKAKQISKKIVRHNLERANRNSDRKSQRKLDQPEPIKKGGGSSNE